ncbi:MAG: hypothetical protein NTX53_20310 [candidate division WOR-3 bacterium]|nr:hypothetical protein [candidate division WOR-3 bacterium]
MTIGGHGVEEGAKGGREERTEEGRKEGADFGDILRNVVFVQADFDSVMGSILRLAGGRVKLAATAFGSQLTADGFPISK